MNRIKFLLIATTILIPVMVWASDEELSFDVNYVYYEDEFRILDIDFSTGTEEHYGDLNLSDSWTTKASGHNPGLFFHPNNGDNKFFQLDADNGVYQVRIPKPLNALPPIVASNSINWSTEPYYIYEGSEIDFRSSNGAIASSENVEWIKLAFDADKQNLKILLSVSDDTNLEDVGFRFVIMPDHFRGAWNEISYMGGQYPFGSIVVDVNSITATSADIAKSKIDSSQVATQVNDPSDSVDRDGNTLLINMRIMNSDPEFFDISTQDFILECVSYNFEDPNPENVDWTKRADFLSPGFLHTFAGGEFTGVTSLDFDGQALSTKWFFAARLNNFNAFSSDRINEFKIGMYGNAVSGYNDAPQAAISGKWVSGFYNGKKYNSSFLFESQVLDNENSVTGVWLTEEAVEVSGVSPETSVIDLAMETAENGMEMNFYYRVSTAGQEHPNVSTIDATWTLFNTFEVTSSRPFYGYQVNKGVVFIRSDALAFPVRLPKWGNTGKYCRLSSTETTSKSTDDLSDLHGLSDFIPIAPSQRVTVAVDPHEEVVLRYMINGTRKQIAKLGLMKLKTGYSLPFGSYISSPDPANLISGSWWLTEYGDEPDNVLEKSDSLDKDTAYHLYFVVQDNDGKYDLDDTPGLILDPTVIGDNTDAFIASGDVGSNSGKGGGGGCFIHSLILGISNG
ncbi:hypothetical protein [Desulfosarcina sp.]|uniref:hypothetical protein n=1 Tax=Desulfosarcina sp. TaxID=2027861 RepID=UPI0039706A13